MNFKRYSSDFNHLFTLAFMLVTSVAALLSFTAHSNEDRYELTQISQLKHGSIAQPNWKQLIANPSNKQQHFVIRESGQVYLVDDGKIQSQVVLDMSIYQPTDSSLFKLTAIELHPNFSLRNQIGYDTFYTAHIEKTNKKNQTKRLQERREGINVSFDTVITEWKLSSINHQKVNLDTKREVVRIGVSDQLMVINQMSFNSYIKPWNDDFGLLYIALNGIEKGAKPLYSGAILRINPTKAGLHSFTVPNSNPYVNMKNSKINDAIYLLGGQNIKQFVWPRKGSEKILVSHKYNNKYLLSLTDGQNDWRDSTSSKVLFQSDDTVYDMLMYKGRQLSLLQSKLLLLRQKEQDWFIDSLEFNLLDKNKTSDDIKPQVEWSITSPQLPLNSQISLSSTKDDEILLLEQTLSILFTVTQQALANESAVVDNVVSNNNEENSSNRFIFIVLIALVMFGTIYFWFNRNSQSTKVIVRKQFAALELIDSRQKIALYKRDQTDAEVILDVVDIVSSEIKLNGQSISIVDAQLENVFNADKEQSLHAIFTNERREKMIDGRIRQISLILTNNQKKSYTVCLYLRKGNDRITKKPYGKVINELIYWCWLIGETINTDR